MDVSFAQQLLASSEVLFTRRLLCGTECKDVVCTMTPYRFILFEHTPKGAKQSKQPVVCDRSLLELTSVYSPKKSTIKIVWSNEVAKANVLEAHTATDIHDIVSIMLYCSKSINHLRPKAQQVIFDGVEDLIQSMVLPNPTYQEAIFATFIATCEFKNVDPKLRVQVVGKLMTAFELEDRFLDLELEGSDDEANDLAVSATLSTLKNTNFFTVVRVPRWSPLKPEEKDSFSEDLALFVQNNPALEGLLLNNTTGTKRAMDHLARAISNKAGLVKIVYANVDTYLAESVVSQMNRDSGTSDVEVLSLIAPTPKVLVQFSGKLPSYTSLRVLEMCSVKAGKMGNDALCAYLDGEVVLQELNLTNCEIQVEQLLSTILGGNSHLRTWKKRQCQLTTLVLSKNKVDERGATLLAQLLSSTTSLRRLFLQSTFTGGGTQRNKCFLEVMDGALNNKTIENFVLDFSENNLGYQKGVAKLGDIVKKRLKAKGTLPIETLNLSENYLTVEGITLLLQLLNNSGMRGFHLAGNLKDPKKVSKKMKQMVGSSGTLGPKDMPKVTLPEMFGMFVLQTSSLVYLNLAGAEGSQFKSILNSLFVCLKENTSVRALDVSGNAINDKGFQLLSEMLAVNSTLFMLDASKNKMSVASLRLIVGAIAGEGWQGGEDVNSGNSTLLFFPTATQHDSIEEELLVRAIDTRLATNVQLVFSSVDVDQPRMNHSWIKQADRSTHVKETQQVVWDLIPDFQRHLREHLPKISSRGPVTAL